jgi:hypothetical protein
METRIEYTEGFERTYQPHFETPHSPDNSIERHNEYFRQMCRLATLEEIKKLEQKLHSKSAM